MAAANSLPFVIPKCIRRSKTAMLKALSATVGIDKTAPHFAYIDDPTTIPTTTNAKRSYFLAKEFGKRAARQLAEEWPTLFMFDRDQPRLEAFRPEKLPMLADLEEVDEHLLRRLIEAKQVTAALKAFERLRAKEAEITMDTIQELFCLTAYFNAQDPPPSENEEWPGLRNFYKDPTPDTSKTVELVSLLYSMADKNAANQSTMICWLSKYGGIGSKNRVLELFNEAKQKKWSLEEDAFINMIHQANTADEINSLLKHMADTKLKPSIRTFNAALTSASKFEGFEKKWKIMQAYLSEASLLGLEPNLTTYHHVLTAVCPAFNENATDQVGLDLSVDCLNEVLTRLESQKTIECQQFSDQQFFNSAMLVATIARNNSLMERVEALYRSKKNQVKMTAFITESAFYGRYLGRKLGMLKDINQIADLYMSLVPRIVGVDRYLILKMMDKLRGTKNWRLIKRIIEDGLSARSLVDREMVQRFSNLLSEVEPNGESMSVTEAVEFENLVVRIVDYLLEFANFSPERDERLHRKITPQIVGEFAVLLLRTNKKDKAWSLLEMLVKVNEFSNVVTNEGRPQQDCLLEAFGVAVKENSLTNAANCLQLIARYNPSYPIKRLVDQLTSHFQLVDTQKQLFLAFSRS